MNVPLQLLQGTPDRRSADIQQRRPDYAPAENAQYTRKNSAKPAQKESFSDLLRDASRKKFDAKSDAAAAKHDDAGIVPTSIDQQPQVKNNENVPQGGSANGATKESAATGDIQVVDAPQDTENANRPTATPVPVATNQNDPQSQSATVNTQPAPTQQNAPPTVDPAAVNGTEGNGRIDAPSQTDSSTASQSSNVATTPTPASELELKPITQVPTQPAVDASTASSPNANAENNSNTTPAVAGAQQSQAIAQSLSQQPDAQQTPNAVAQSMSVKPDQAAQQPVTQEQVAQPDLQRAQRNSNQIRQQILRHVETADIEESPKIAPAVRRAGDVNSRLALENSNARAFASTDSLASQGNISISTVGQGAAIKIETFNPPLLGVPTPQTPVDQTIDETRFTNNVARGLSALVNQRGGVMHMRLDPPELGQLRIQMSISRGAVSAQFQAADAQAGALLEQNMSTLRTALERHGLSVERLAVQVHQPASSQQSTGQQLNDQSSQQDGRNQNQHDAAGGQSRGRDDQPGDERSERQRFGRFAETKPFNFAQALKTAPAQE